MGRKDKPLSPVSGGNLNIGQLMRQYRQTKGISLTGMARKLDYSTGYLSMIENGHKQPPHELVKSYEKILGLEIGKLSKALQPTHVTMLANEHSSAYQSHIEIIKQGVNLWNRWRADHPEIRPSLTRANLGETDLSGANLNSADLTRADLSGARLSMADLSGSILRQAHMNRAILNGTNLSRSYLNGAKLFSANLNKANLSEANLSGADLSEANLSGADLSNVNLSGADLSNVDLSGSDLTKTNLTGAYLSKTDLSNATVTNTIFGNLDLRQVIGLESLKHIGPSAIGLDTVVRSQGDLPDVFLRKAGLPETFIDYVRSLAQHPIEYYTCFISYSSKDQAFAERLYADLQSKGVRCWFAPEDMKIGDKIRSRIDDSIRLYDKLVLVLSEHSIASAWVEFEVESALEKEARANRLVLFPVRLDDAVMQTEQAWSADIRRMRFIGDFRNWKQHDDYQKALHRLLRDLY